MPKQDYYQAGQLTDVAYLVLVSLATPKHGYLIMSAIEEMTHGEMKIGPASLYTTLKKLTDVGFICLLSDVHKKKTYKLTTKGYEALKVEIRKRERYANFGKMSLEGSPKSFYKK